VKNYLGKIIIIIIIIVVVMLILHVNKYQFNLLELLYHRVCVLTVYCAQV